jgi:L-threonylcarbamoyladenylate synthase
VLDDLDGRIDAILDAGATEHGVESTVLDPNQSPMMIYRPGAITAEQIRAVAGPVDIFRSLMLPNSEPREALPSPGVGLRHYAPRAKLVLVEAPLAELATRISEIAAQSASDRIGLMLPAEIEAAQVKAAGAIVFPWGHWAASEELAHNLYAGLRTLDAQGCTLIVCPLPLAEGLGAAIRDRLLKAGH